jgi:proline iminopeptidase
LTLKKIILVITLLLVLCAAWLAWLLFYPRSYNVIKLKERAGTKYWMLPTGSRIAYTVVPAKGEKKPFPLIYLHGGPGAGITDLEISILGKLADEGYDVYLYDQIGCGHSGRLKNINDYSAERHRQDLEEIVKQINADKVILIGQSWGSILSVLYIADNPGKVEKLVITAPAPIQPENKAYGAIASPDSLTFRAPLHTYRPANIIFSNFRSKAIEFSLRKFGKKMAGDKEADQLATYFTNFLNKSMVCDSSKAVVAEGTEGYYVHFMTRLSLGKVENPRPKLVNCKVPALIMKAQCDNQRWGYTTEYLDIFRNHRFVMVKDAGHNIFIEQPDAYAEAIRNFLLQPSP